MAEAPVSRGLGGGVRHAAPVTDPRDGTVDEATDAPPGRIEDWFGQGE